MTTPANPILFLLQIISSLLITLLLLNVMKVSSIIIWRRKTAHTTPPLPPGTCGLPLIGETLSFLAANNSSRGFYDFVRIRRQRYGNCFKTNIFGKTHVFVSSNEAAKLILGNDSIDFTKRYISSIAELLGDQSLLCASQGNHRLVRSHMSRLFSADSLSSSVRLFDKMTIEALTNWKQKQTVVVLDEALKITFRAICKMLISLETEDELQMLQKDVSEVSEAMLAIPSNLPWTRFFRGLKARKRIMNALLEIINARRNGLEFHEDFLQSLLMKDESSGGYSLTDTQIQDNILTLIIAGQITTASAIAWMVKYLDENKEVQDQLRDRNLALASKIPGSHLELEFLNEMSYASKIVKESLRMATIVSWFPRIALRDCVIEGYQIKKGWIVNVDARHIHSDSMLYEDPTKFCPARFDEDQKPYSFLAFGMGGRTCLGMNLAKALMLVFLHRLVTTYSFGQFPSLGTISDFRTHKVFVHLPMWVVPDFPTFITIDGSSNLETVVFEGKCILVVLKRTKINSWAH